MSAGAIVALVLIVVLVVAVGGALIAGRIARRRRFGAEYDRLVREAGTRRARAEFEKRRRRVAGLGLKPLTAEQRTKYDARWTAAQERFIDSPPQAAQAAAALVTSVAADLGYQVDDREQLLADLSVHHGRRLDGYRRAGRTTDRAEAAATEELRRALLDHRTLFRDLLDTAGAAAASGSGRSWQSLGARRPPSARDLWLRTRSAWGRLALRSQSKRALPSRGAES